MGVRLLRSPSPQPSPQGEGEPWPAGREKILSWAGHYGGRGWDGQLSGEFLPFRGFFFLVPLGKIFWLNFLHSALRECRAAMPLSQELSFINGGVDIQQ